MIPDKIRDDYFLISSRLNKIEDYFPETYDFRLIKRPLLRRSAGIYNATNIFEPLIRKTKKSIKKKRDKILESITKSNILYENFNLPFSIIKEICSFEDNILDNYNEEKIKLLNKNIINSDKILIDMYLNKHIDFDIDFEEHIDINYNDGYNSL